MTKKLRAVLPAGVKRPLKRLVPGPRDFLISMFPPQSVGAEIGVWKGDFSSRLMKRVHPRVLHLVDPWQHSSDPVHQGAWYAGGIAQDQAEMDAIAEGVIKRFAKELADGRVVLHRGLSVVVAEEIEDGSLDWVYIDGDHSYGAVVADLEAWWTKIVPGGLLAGDDYSQGGWWGDGVMRAVDEFFAGRSDAQLVTIENAQFVFRRT